MMNSGENRFISLYQSWKHSLSLRQKLVYLISAVSLLMVSIFMIASFGIELYFFRNRLVDEYRATAGMVGSNLEAAIVFEDARDSQEIMSKLGRYVNVETAGLYLEDNRLLATYFKEDSPLAIRVLGPDVETLIDWGRIIVNEPIYDEGDSLIGRIVLEANLGEMRSYLLAKGAVFTILLIFVFVFAVLLALRLGRMMALPIVELTKTANRIAKDHDFTVRPVRITDDETGQLVDAFNEMMTQVSARDEVIRSSEKRFRDYFDLGVVGAGILDTRFCWIEANDRMLDMLHCSIDDISGNRLWDLLSDGDVGLTLEQFNNSIEGDGDRVATREFWLRKDDRTFVYVLISMRYVPPTKYLSEHIILMAQDITNRKRYEEAILKAKEEAEASSRAKDEFLSVISHELRTPLNPIIGYVDLLIEERDDVEDPLRLNLVKRSAEHLLGLIDDVLDYSRIERGVIAFNRETVNYQTVCKNVVELLSRNVDFSKLSLNCVHLNESGEGVSKSILIDRIKFRQVVINLVSNALKFTRSGSVELRTILRKKTNEGFTLTVEVEDTGIGIDEMDFDRVFKAFSQIDSSLTRRHSGMGLGLAISLKIVNAFGGTLDFRSKKGQGSLFFFEIPVTLTKEKVKQSVPALQNKESRGRSRHPVLLVEDETINMELARSLIKREGQDVVCARDGLDALEKLSDGEFSLIIMDVRMPRMDGLEATRKIRKLEQGKKRTPIIAVSANATNQDKEECFSAGMDGYVPKPLSIRKLNTIMDDWL